jgi:hypothetical protein
MPKDTDLTETEAVDAAWGERMIEVRVRFFTNGIAEGKGQVRPKHAWAQGMVRMERNESHGIGTSDPLPFNSLMEIPAAIERLLIAHNIRLHASDRERRYYNLPPKGPAKPTA